MHAVLTNCTAMENFDVKKKNCFVDCFAVTITSRRVEMELVGLQQLHVQHFIGLL
jgi:hypothetical protein